MADATDLPEIERALLTAIQELDATQVTLLNALRAVRAFLPDGGNVAPVDEPPLPVRLRADGAMGTCSPTSPDFVGTWIYPSTSPWNGLGEACPYYDSGRQLAPGSTDGVAKPRPNLWKEAYESALAGNKADREYSIGLGEDPPPDGPKLHRVTFGLVETVDLEATRGERVVVADTPAGSPPPRPAAFLSAKNCSSLGLEHALLREEARLFVEPGDRVALLLADGTVHLATIRAIPGWQGQGDRWPASLALVPDP